MATNIKFLLLSIVLCLWTSFAWAFPSGFIGAVATGSSGQISYCAANPGYIFCDDFSAGISGWINVGGGAIEHDSSTGSGALKITASSDGSTPADVRKTAVLPTGTLNWTIKMYIPCSGGFTRNLRMQGGESTSMIFVDTKPTACDTWEVFSGTITGGTGGSYMKLADRYNITSKIMYVKDVRIWQ